MKRLIDYQSNNTGNKNINPIFGKTGSVSNGALAKNTTMPQIPQHDYGYLHSYDYWKEGTNQDLCKADMEYEATQQWLVDQQLQQWVVDQQLPVVLAVWVLDQLVGADQLVPA